ncbi:hypothetical protein [Isoptericola aurantiacus]|uniref:hypothetical protein n=1 Tax=Isoptericola aurantiacus TaxID=3377839 RepID=UPI00383B7548
MTDTQWRKLDGDAELVRTKGEKYRQIADAIDRATTTLQAIVDDTGTTAQSMDATRRLASDVLEDIAKATVRYRDTGDALVGYAGSLDPAIVDSDTAATRIAEIEDDLGPARWTAFRAQQTVDWQAVDAAPADVTDANDALRTADDRVAGLEQDLATWQARWTEAKSAKDSAAGTAKDKIDEVVTGSKVNGLEDSTWDKIKDVAASVYKVFKIICDVAGILAIFLSWVPGLGQVLLALAAIGSLLAIVEGIVKISREGFSWGALAGIGLGVLGLFGGKAIGAVAKYAKARSVVRTAGRMSSTAAKAKFGGALIKGSRRTLALSRGQRVTGVLKSPFGRSATDKAVFGLLKNGERGKALSTWRAAQFPLPYKDGAARFALGNADVMDMHTHFGKFTGLAMDNATVGAAAFATVGAVTHQAVNLTNNAYKFGTSVAGGDGWGVASSSNSVVSQPAGGSWGSISGIPMKVAGWFG